MSSTRHPSLSCAEIERALRDSGRRLTPQRRAIIEYLAGRGDHPSARQVHRDLLGRRRAPRMSLATVYNTLATLVEAGVLTQIDFEATDNRYDTNVTPHLNLVCTACGSIRDVEHELPVDLEEVRREEGFEVNQVRLEYRGVCATCRRRSARGRSRSRTEEPP